MFSIPLEILLAFVCDSVGRHCGVENKFCLLNSKLKLMEFEENLSDS